MTKIYIDSNFLCHAAAGDGLQEIETDFFDGKCAAFIEGYRFVPAGKNWTRKDGTVFTGEMAAPVRDYAELEEIQSAVDREQAELDAAYQEGVNSL